jgi:hypothetical protein
MSDAAVLMTAFDAATPANVISSWCVATGDYDQHTLNVAPAQLKAVVTSDGCKEPAFLNKMLQLLPDAVTYRVTGSGGHYTISGPVHREH